MDTVKREIEREKEKEWREKERNIGDELEKHKETEKRFNLECFKMICKALLDLFANFEWPKQNPI